MKVFHSTHGWNCFLFWSVVFEKTLPLNAIFCYSRGLLCSAPGLLPPDLWLLWNTKERHLSCRTAADLPSEATACPVQLSTELSVCLQLKHSVDILSKIYWTTCLFTVSVATFLPQGNSGEYFWFPLSIALSKEMLLWVALKTQL